LTEKKVNDRMSANLQALNAQKLKTATEDENDTDSDTSNAESSQKDKPRNQRSLTRSLSSIQNRADKFRAQRGLSQDIIDESDEAKTEANLHAMTHLKQADNQEYSCNSLGRIKRAHFSHLNGCEIGNSVDGDGVERSVDEKKRRAQDLLLAQELKRGIIPEQLLRKIPRMGDLISLDLSHYSMGDELCICLGNR
jgi:hypothetical protein